MIFCSRVCSNLQIRVILARQDLCTPVSTGGRTLDRGPGFRLQVEELAFPETAAALRAEELEER